MCSSTVGLLCRLLLVLQRCSFNFVLYFSLFLLAQRHITLVEQFSMVVQRSICSYLFILRPTSFLRISISHCCPKLCISIERPAEVLLSVTSSLQRIIGFIPAVTLLKGLLSLSLIFNCV